jgi:hypothetical protein
LNIEKVKSTKIIFKKKINAKKKNRGNLKKKGKLEKKIKKYRKKILLITIIIYSDFRCGNSNSSTPLDVCIIYI